ncbi:MAG: tRNA pseudouridine(55) synthase TruB [Steroidobacteraceae bacterium]
MSGDVHGILLLDKPLGLTSAAAVAKVKRLLGVRKVGHMGSLDPLATGLLPIGVGEATKFGAQLLDADKTYRVTVRLGERTPSADRETAVCEQAPVPALDEQGMRSALAAFPRRYAQMPPMHSALKQGGRPLYSYARAGITLEREAREVLIHGLDFLAWQAPELSFEVTVSKGTYIRTLAEDMATSLSTVGHLTSLRRLAVRPFGPDAMIDLQALEATPMAQRSGFLLPVDAALGHLPRLLVDEAACLSLSRGQAVAVPVADGPPAGQVRIIEPSGRFLGIGEIDAAGLLHPRRLVAAPAAAGALPAGPRRS